MIKKIIYIILICSVVFSQSSLLSLSGFGEKIESNDAASISLGDSKFFAGNSFSISKNSPSSLWKSNLANLYITGSMSKINMNDNNLDEIKENHLQIISFTFPIGEFKALSFGFSPMYRGNTTVVEQDLNFIGADQSPTNYPIAYRTTYDFTGGISELFGMCSMKISKEISIGLRLSKLFGNSNHRYVLQSYNVETEEDETVSYDVFDTSFGDFKQRYSSNSYKIELRYFKQNFEAVASYLKSSSLKIKLTPEYDLIGESNSEIYFINKTINEFGLGLKYSLNDDLGLIIESHKFSDFNSYDFLNIFRMNSPDIISNHFGIYKIMKINKENNLDQINFRAGFYSKNYKFSDIYNLYNNNLKDYGFTFGIGFEYNKNMNLIDLAFVSGNRESNYIDIDSERYFKFIFSITSSEKWFERKEE